MEELDLARQSARSPLTQDQLKELVRQRESYGASGEARYLELKRGLASRGHRKREDWNKLLVTAVSMANSGGGYVVLGVGDAGELVGVSDKLVEMLDPARLQDQLKEYSPNASLSTQLTVVAYYGKTYVSLWVRPSTAVIIFDKDGNYQGADDKTAQAFSAGVVYTRDSGGRCRADHLGLDDMVRDLVEQRLSDIAARIEKVVHLPPEADLLAAHPGAPNRAYRLISKGEGVPVRITSEADQDDAVPLLEVFRTDVPYQAADDEVRAQVRFWMGKRDHRVSRDVCFSWYLRRAEIDWDPEASTFCFLSACAGWGYPLFWAQKLFEHDPSKLRGLLEAEAASASYPSIEYVPYTAGAFFWDSKDSLLAAVRATSYSRAGQIAEKVDHFPSQEDFLVNARVPGTHLRIQDRSYRKRDLLDDKDLARRLLEEVVELRHDLDTGQAHAESSAALSAAGHQLDLLCHHQLDA